MKAIFQQLLTISFLFRCVLSGFECKESVDSTREVCKTELRCRFDEDYDRIEKRFCRCKITIEHFSLPDNTLTFDLFSGICFQRFNNLKQLWIQHADLQYLDNNIFEKYPNLVHLDLSDNQVSLNFSKQAEKITTLNASYNKIDELKDEALADLRSLRVVDLSFNRLAQIGTGLKNLKSVEEVYMNNNQLTQIEKNDFEPLQKLRILNLAHNFLVSIKSPLFFLHLQELYLNNNRLKSINAQEFVRLPSLRILKIGNNLFETLSDNHLFNQLEEFHGENNQIKALNGHILNKLENLKMVNLSNNALKNIEGDTFATSNRIKVVDLSSNKLAKIDPRNFRNMNNVSFLNLYNNSLTQEVISCDNLQNLMQLNVLDLSYNEISEIYTCTFRKLEKLQKLSLLANHLKTIPPSAFQTLHNLQELNLAHNQLTEIPENSFEGLGELRNLNISHNRLTKFDIDSLDGSPKVTKFDLKCNNLTAIDLKLLRDKQTVLRELDFDDSLIKCDAFGEVFDYFAKNEINVRSCAASGCCKNHISQKLLIGIIVGVIVCLLAAFGLIVILYKLLCGRKKEPKIHLVPIIQNQNQ
ncbi:insulin-like growth factor-binding protein complex acid labile subunit [Tribolium castaneum]|uniref:insulin-like growth factor-binding protein complex acid labile subunit n=1 Tax=Tribolium castaneum TaxID=7070 RepID=UPI0030FDFEF6